MDRPKYDRITVGVLIGYISSPFYRGIVQGINDAAEENNVNIIFFAGGVVNPPTNSCHRNIIYNLASEKALDGVIVPTALFRYLDPAELMLFLERFSGIPVVNIGSPLQNVPSVAADVLTGMDQLMSHLILDHGYKRIALIRGPHYHYDSETRHEAYRELLKKYGIPYREELVVSADIVEDFGRKGIARLQEQCSLDCDVITVVGDQMTVRVVKALQEKGINVPGDIRVASLQGVSDGQYFNPPMTVVDDNLYNQAKKGLINLIRLIKGESVPMIQFEPTNLVIRHSCGCSVNPGQQFDGSFETAATLDALIGGQRRKVIRQMNRSAIENSSIHRCQLDEAELNRVLDVLVDDLRGQSSKFSTAVEKMMGRVSSIRYKLLPWIGALLALYRIPAGRVTVAEKERWDKLWVPVLEFMNQLQGRTLRFQEQGYQDNVEVFRRVAQTLFTEYRPEMFKEVLIDAAGISDGYVVLYDNQQPGQTGRLIVAYSQKQELTLPEEGKEFPVRQFLPPGVLNDCTGRFSLIAQSLYAGEIDFGYIVNSMDVPDLAFYTAIQSQLGGALNNQYQFQELRAAEQRFSDIAYSSSDWLWETDKDGRFTYCSDGVYGVLGYNANELLGRTIFDFLAPSEAEYKAYLQNELFRQKEPIRNLENWNLHKDGHLVGLLISGTPIIKADGQLVGYRGLFKDITEHKRAEEKVRQIAYYDRLTGLPNRAFLMTFMEEALVQLEHDPAKMAMLFIDLDRFKNVNDNLGHDVGDRLLKLVAERLKGSSREKDILARLGGDEFIFLLNDIDSDGKVIDDVCKRIFADLVTPFSLNGYHFFVTCSIGIAVYPDDGTDAASLMKNADTAMYRSKAQGRNRFVFYDREMEVDSINRMRLENNLHQALLHNEFFMEYQPQVDTVTGEITGLEALIRWNDPELGPVPPSDFIPIAEETGLIIPIGEWVLKTVIDQMQAWEKLKLPPLQVAINVSAQQFLNGDIVRVFSEIMKQSGVDPGKIQIEITESAFIDRDKTVYETLVGLKQLGFTIALDDFGTGYSSLSSLKRFPLDVIKIDQSFIQDLTTDLGSSSGIVNAIVLMAKSLMLKVIAEGVETCGQLAKLRRLNCDGIQGFLFSRPVSAEVVPGLFERHNGILHEEDQPFELRR